LDAAENTPEPAVQKFRPGRHSKRSRRIPRVEWRPGREPDDTTAADAPIEPHLGEPLLDWILANLGRARWQPLRGGPRGAGALAILEHHRKDPDRFYREALRIMLRRASGRRRGY
jgi:hypothetical protein